MNVLAIKPKIPNVEALTEQYLGAKANLKTAQEIFQEAEEALMKAVGHKDEGSFSFIVADKFKVTTTGKINRTLSAAAWEQMKTQIPEPLANRLVRYKPELNLKELRYVELNEQDLFKFISKVITSRPGKASLKVDVIEG